MQNSFVVLAKWNCIRYKSQTVSQFLYDGSFVQSINKYGLNSSRILYPLSKDLSVSIHNEKKVSEKKHDEMQRSSNFSY